MPVKTAKSLDVVAEPLPATAPTFELLPLHETEGAAVVVATGAKAVLVVQAFVGSTHEPQVVVELLELDDVLVVGSAHVDHAVELVDVDVGSAAHVDHAVELVDVDVGSAHVDHSVLELVDVDVGSAHVDHSVELEAVVVGSNVLVVDQASHAPVVWPAPEELVVVVVVVVVFLVLPHASPELQLVINAVVVEVTGNTVVFDPHPKLGMQLVIVVVVVE